MWSGSTHKETRRQPCGLPGACYAGMMGPIGLRFTLPKLTPLICFRFSTASRADSVPQLYYHEESPVKSFGHDYRRTSRLQDGVRLPVSRNHRHPSPFNSCTGMAASACLWKIARIPALGLSIERCRSGCTGCITAERAVSLRAVPRAGGTYCKFRNRRNGLVDSVDMCVGDYLYLAQSRNACMSARIPPAAPTASQEPSLGHAVPYIPVTMLSVV